MCSSRMTPAEPGSWLGGSACCKIRFYKQQTLTGALMAQVCEICGKGPQFGNNISHAHNVSKRRWNVNLRPIRARVKGGTKRIRVCTSCLRSGKVVKA